jgi:hypothetical protein
MAGCGGAVVRLVKELAVAAECRALTARPSRLLYFNARNTVFLLPDRNLSFQQTPYVLRVPVRYFSGGSTRADISSSISPLLEQRIYI